MGFLLITGMHLPTKLKLAFLPPFTSNEPIGNAPALWSPKATEIIEEPYIQVRIEEPNNQLADFTAKLLRVVSELLK